jgi:hypothetical protein
MAIRRVKANFGGGGDFIGFTDPDKEDAPLAHDEGISRLSADPDSGLIFDSLGNEVGVGAMAFPEAGAAFDFKYKAAEYTPFPGAPEEFIPGPGQTLQVRVLVVDPLGGVNVVYKSFGEGEEWSQDKENEMLQEAASAEFPGLTYVTLGYEGETGVEISKEYTVMTVSTRPIGP